MFRAHFGEGRNFWTIDQVVGFAAELGLDPVEARTVLENRTYRQRVENDQRDARSLGASGTPFMVIDSKHAIAGSRDTDELLNILRRVGQEQPSIRMTETNTCPSS
jgi:predicted DsbA family dithiol-disulfide isomerase